MKKLLLVSVFLALGVSTVSSVAEAARPSTGGSTKELIGYDVSYPQCRKKLPTEFYFAIVGVNGGTAAVANPCLADQLVWANKAKDGSKQPKVQLYVNTANPGEVKDTINTWPKSPYDSTGNLPPNPYGNTCSGSNDLACSWLYGWNRSIYTEGVFRDAAQSKGISTETASYVWWMDVETMNTWQVNGQDALLKNTAAIEGFAKYYQAKGAPVGLYSTAQQWGQITGNSISTNSNLRGLANWRPSGASLSNAKTNCTVAPLTEGGSIALTQYVIKNLDHNHSCI